MCSAQREGYIKSMTSIFQRERDTNSPSGGEYHLVEINESPVHYVRGGPESYQEPNYDDDSPDSQQSTGDSTRGDFWLSQIFLSR